MTTQYRIDRLSAKLGIENIEFYNTTKTDCRMLNDHLSKLTEDERKRLVDEMNAAIKPVCEKWCKLIDEELAGRVVR